MFKSKYFRTITFATALFAFNGYTAAEPAQFTTIDYPGAAHTYAQGNNPAGDVVGGYRNPAPANDYHGFLLRNGEFTSFDVPGALWTDPYGINSRGDIVGQYGWKDGLVYTVRGFLLRDGIFYPIDIAGQQNTMPFKINPSGTIVGCNHFNINDNGGIVLATMTGFSADAFGNAFNTPFRSMNLGINPAGDTVGYSFTTPAGADSTRAERSYLIRDGNTTFFQFPGAFATLATDINAAGTIVGRYRPSSTTLARGFILDDGEFEPFDVPGATQTFPYGISSKGTIVGYYQVGTSSTATYHGFLLSSRGE